MNTIKKLTNLKDRKVILSTLWIFAMFNYLYADVLTLIDPLMFSKIVTGTSAVRMTPGALLAAAILMETAIVMILLSRVLNYRANRWSNIIAGVIHTLAVFSSMFVTKPAHYYLFCGIIEISCTLFIIWFAWSWPKPEDIEYNKI
jgi:hypothetical protein